MSAQKVGVTGWVVNERDGTVTAEVQGSAQEQLAFITRLTTIVTGHGYDWTVASEQSVDLVEGERTFCVR